MVLAFLIVLALVGDQRRAVTELKETGEKVGIEPEVARLGPGPFARAHAPDGEGAEDELVAELQEVSRAVTQEGHDHFPGSPELVRVLSAKEEAEAPGEAGLAAGVGSRPGDG